MVSSSISGFCPRITASWKLGLNFSPWAGISFTPKSSKVFTNCFWMPAMPSTTLCTSVAFSAAASARSKLSRICKNLLTTLMVTYVASSSRSAVLRRRKLSKSAWRRSNRFLVSVASSSFVFSRAAVAVSFACTSSSVSSAASSCFVSSTGSPAVPSPFPVPGVSASSGALPVTVSSSACAFAF